MGVLQRSRCMEDIIRRGEMQRFRNRWKIIRWKEKATGKFSGTWYLRGEYTSTVKVQWLNGQ